MNTKTTVCKVAGITLLVILTLVACDTGSKQQTNKTQEEYQMELLDSLRTMGLVACQGDISLSPGVYREEFYDFMDDLGLPVDYKAVYTEIRPRIEIAPDIEIFYDKLEMIIYSFSLDGRFTDKLENIATIEDIAKLYASYDEELDKRFYNLFRCWSNMGNSFLRYYEKALRVAYSLYLEQYGFFNEKEHYGEMMAEDKIALENFVRNNPDFMPKEVYYIELRSMRIITSQERDNLEKATKEATKNND
jgi:hypothetical protein